jgi:hypothetical protein
MRFIAERGARVEGLTLRQQIHRRSNVRKTSLSATIVLAAVLAAAVAAWAETAELPSGGQVFTVINYKRAQGRAQPTSVLVATDSARRSKTVIPPYRRCDTTTPAGFVLKMRHVAPDTTISTSGEIVRFAGEMPLEVLHPCYKLVLF